MVDPVSVVVVAVWAMLPAYVPNNVAVVAGGGPPIDGGRTWGGARLLGDGKTWRGTAAGVVAGVALGLLQNALVRRDVVPTVGEASVGVVTFPLAALVALAAGAMLGDILASFAKRRIGQERGAAVPGLDQLDFVVVSLGLTAVVATGWFVDTFWVAPLVVVLVATPLLHVSTNYVAFRAGLKDVPW
jgi:CDP-2,3-bis-(O-geranylgeranyl)-sn-glycerol synthase